MKQKDLTKTAPNRSFDVPAARPAHIEAVRCIPQDGTYMESPI